MLFVWLDQFELGLWVGTLRELFLVVRARVARSMCRPWQESQLLMPVGSVGFPKQCVWHTVLLVRSTLLMLVLQVQHPNVARWHPPAGKVSSFWCPVCFNQLGEVRTHAFNMKAYFFIHLKRFCLDLKIINARILAAVAVSIGVHSRILTEGYHKLFRALFSCAASSLKPGEAHLSMVSNGRGANWANTFCSNTTARDSLRKTLSESHQKISKVSPQKQIERSSFVGSNPAAFRYSCRRNKLMDRVFRPSLFLS